MLSTILKRLAIALLLTLPFANVRAVPIDASQATTLTIPPVPGDGVSIKLYNGIGGGRQPLPSDLEGRQPSGTTLSPFIDFPRPGSIISVGQSFNTFFANTANPPDQVDGLAALNFILAHRFFLKVTPDLDRNPATPEIDIQLGVGSDDGFYLTVGTTFIGSAGDRSFSTSAYDLSFAQPGLYEVSLLFAANSVGQSGLEFYWATAATGGLALVPQSAMYTSAVVGQQLITFEENPLTTVPTDQYRAKGVVFNVTSGDLQITSAFPNDFVPVTQPSVFGSPTATPAQAQTVELNFVAPGTNTPGITNLVQLFILDADVAPGAHIVAIDQHGQTVYDQRIVTGGGAQQQVTIAAPQIMKVIVELGGAGVDTAAIDNVGFNTPVAADLVPPVVEATRIFSNRVEVDFLDAGGMDAASMTIPQNYVLKVSGGDGVFGNANDRTIAVSSVTAIDANTVRLDFGEVLRDEVYRLTILETPGITDNSGNRLDGDANGTEGGVFNQTLTLDLLPASVTLDMQATSDTGPSNADNTTSNRQPVFDLTVSEYGVVGLDYNGGGVDITQAFAPGTFPFTTPSPLADGTYTAVVTFNALTPSGSPATNTLTFTIDTTAPVISGLLYNGLALAEGGVVRSAGTLRANVSDATGVARVEFHVRPAGGTDVLLNSDTTSADGFTADWNVNAAANGAYVFTVRAFDQFGAMTETTRAVSLNFNVGPVITSTTFRGAAIADGAAVTTSGRFGVTATDSDGLDRVEFFYKPAASSTRTSLGTDSNGADGFDALWVADSLDDGAFDLIARVFDRLGAFTEVSRRVNLALAVPAAPVILTPADGSTVQPATLQITGTAAASPTLRIYRNGAQVFSGSAESNGTFSVSVPLLDGQNLLYAESVNRAGASEPSNPVMVTRLEMLPTVGVVFSPATVLEGTGRAGTVTLSSALSSATTFALVSSRPTRVSVPESVTIPAGQTSVGFIAQSLQNQAVELPVSVSVSATAAGFDPASAALQVLDDDQPAITLAFDRAEISERDGSPAAQGTITLDRSVAFPLRVNFSASPTTDLILPPQVEIPANSLGAIFPIGVVNNVAVDGSRVVSVVAQLMETSGANAVAQSAPATLTIHDDDGPALALAVDRTLLIEGASPAATATVSRSPVTASPVFVTLACSDTSEMTAPVSVTIPAGQPSVSFPLQAIADGQPDGNQPVTLTASASGFSPASQKLTVTDLQKPDLFVDLISPPTGAETDAWIDVRLLLRNQGATDAQGPYTQRISLSTDSLPGDDLLLTQANFAGRLIAGGSIEQSLRVKLPRTAGRFWLVVETDANRALDEALEDNNIAVSATPLDIEPAYLTTLSIAPETVPTSTPIPITGAATLRTGGAAAFVLVNIHIVRGTVSRVISALTDSLGHYSTTFTPLPGDGGLFEFFATHPGTETAPVQDSVRVYGLKSDPASLDLKLSENASQPGQIVITNLTDLPLTSLQATVVGAPAGITFTPAFASGNLAPSGTIALNYTVATEGPLARTPFTISVASLEGAALQIPVAVTVTANAPQLVAEPADLTTGMLRGQQQIVTFQIRNDGSAASAPVNLLLPSGAPWIRVATTLPLAPLAPGESAPITLLLTPSADLPLQEYSGNLVATGGAVGLSIPYHFRALSDQTGQLIVRTEDEYTYYASGNPPLAGATVRVRDALTRQVIGTIVSNASGVADFGPVREGYYEVEATADKHGTYRATHLIRPGTPNNIPAFLSRETISYTWTVEPVQIEDRYKVTIESTFETVVPIPVVTVEPNVIDLAEITADETVVNIKVTNHGLLAADNTRFGVPSHPLWEFTPAIDSIGVLPAKSSITVPMRIRRVGAGAPAPAPALGLAPPPAPDLGPCNIATTVCWDLVCGKLTNTYCAVVALPNARTGCGGEPPNPTGTGCVDCGGFNPGPSSSSSSVGATLVCDPECLVLAGLGCIPGPVGCFFGGFACGKGLADGVAVIDLIDCGVGAAGCLVPGAGIPACIYAITRCFIQPPPAPGDGGGGGGGAAGQPISFDPITQYKPGLRAMLDVFNAITGAPDGVWLNPAAGPATGDWWARFQLAANVTSDGGREITLLERAALLTGVLPPGVQGAEIQRLLDRWNRSVENWSIGIFSPADAPVGANLDFIDAILLRQKLRLSGDYQLIAEQAGFTDPINAIVETVRARQSSGESGGVCGRIKLKLEQEAVLTRDAFRATLEIENKTATPLENIRVNVTVISALGSGGTELFDLGTPDLSVLTGVDGTGTLAGNSSGTAKWLIIPTVDAAPNAPERFFVGGTLSYRVDGLDITVPFSEVAITVLPSPRLTLKYFHQRDVFSDDPFTDRIEPAIPYMLAVMVKNNGGGAANSFTITSAQPTIIENEKGLLADFQIIATQVDGQPLQPSLTANLGNIAPGQLKIAQWLLTSSIQGLFTDYKATFEHIDGRGNPRLSQIESVEIHEMIHPVRGLGATHDTAPDFLVNDVPDIRDLPDTIHLSDGTTAPVALRETAQIFGTLSPGNLVLSMTAAMPSGWAYLRIPEPSDGQYVLQRVMRSDGLEIPIDVNVWVTDRTFIGQARRPAYENILHLLDEDSTGSYTLTYAVAQGLDTVFPTSRVLSLPAQSAIEFPVSWEGTDDRRVAAFDVYVSVNGGPFSLWLQGSRDTGAIYAGALGNTYAFYSRAIDGAGNVEAAPAIADATTTVTLTNIAPTLAVIPDQEINEGETLTLNLAGNDPDGRADLLRYAFVGTVPPGLTINAQTGLVRWITGEADGGREVHVQVRVTDSGVPAQSATRSFNVRVLEQNQAPVFQPLEPQRVAPGSQLSVQLSAQDSDLPAQTIRYRFAGPSPATMLLDVVTGRITWTPTVADADRTFAVAVAAADNGVPALETTMLVSITVDPANLDRAPQFLASPTQLWFIGTTRTLEVGAFDPDGDAVTMALNGPGLPAGLSLSSTPGTGRGLLTWNTAGLAPGVYALPVKAIAGAAQAIYSPTVKLVKDNAYWRWAGDKLGTLADLNRADPTEDPDGDGTSNVHEWALLRDPQKRDETRFGLAAETYEDGWISATLSLHRRRGSNQFVTLVPQASPSLGNASWADLPTTDWDAEIDPNGDDDHDPETEQVFVHVLFQLTIDGAADRKFFRLKSATRPILP